jgi:hypothetical protein
MKAWTRREFLRQGVRAGAALGPLTGTLVAACTTERRPRDFVTRYDGRRC